MQEEREVPEFLKFERFIFQKVLFRRGKSLVCEYKDIHAPQGNDIVIIKVDHPGQSNLLNEALFYNKNRDLTCVPKYVMHDTD
jgi:hypothetical protein